MAEKALMTMAGNLSLPMMRLTVNLTADTAPAEAQIVVDKICVAMVRQAQSLGSLRVMLGQTIRQIQQRELFKPDYPNFEAYLVSLNARHGLSRTVVREALMFVNAFPNLLPAEAENIPVYNQTLAARAAKNVATPKEREKLLKEASTLQVVPFRDKLIERNLLSQRGRPIGGSKKSGPVDLRIPGVPARLARLFRERAGDAPAKYLAHLMDLDSAQAA